MLLVDRRHLRIRGLDAYSLAHHIDMMMNADVVTAVAQDAVR